MAAAAPDPAGTAFCWARTGASARERRRESDACARAHTLTTQSPSPRASARQVLEALKLGLGLCQVPDILVREVKDPNVRGIFRSLNEVYPIGAVKPNSRYMGEVLRVMRTLAEEGRTMVVVTHEMGFARRVAHRVVFMDQGAIVEDAKKVDFFGTPRSERAQQFLSKILHH